MLRTSGDTVTVTCSPTRNASAGLNVTTLLTTLKLPATGPESDPFAVNVCVPIVVGSISALNVISMLASLATSSACTAGVWETSVGGSARLSSSRSPVALAVSCQSPGRGPPTLKCA